MVLGCYTDDVPPLKRIVVAIDPSASSSEDFNERGIVRASLGDDDQGYILDDLSGVMASIGTDGYIASSGTEG
jgi:phage terminase large subunit-like protein